MPAISGRRRAPESAPSRYRTVLALPGAVAFFLPSLPIRLGCAMYSLGLVVLVHDETGSYARAGTVAGVAALAIGAGGPLTARCCDRYGQRRTLVSTVSVSVVALLALVLAVRWHASPWTWYPLAALTGGCLPPVGALTRTRWAARAPDATLLTTAFAIESLTDDLSYVLGPALATLVGAGPEPAAGPLLAATLIAVGGIGLARTADPATGPARPATPKPSPGRARPATSTPTTGQDQPPTPVPATGQAPPRPARTWLRAGNGGGRRRGPLTVTGVWVLLAASVGIGGVFSGIQVSLTALANAQGVPGAAGPAYAGFGVASMVAGLTYGAVRWHAPPYRRLVIALTVLSAGCVPLSLVDGLGPAAVAVAVPGLALAPTLITVNALAERLVPRAVLTESFAWLGASSAIGSAGGAALAGRLVDAGGAHRGFLLPVVAAAAAALAVAAARRHLRVD